MNNRAAPKEQKWFPCYSDRLLASSKWQAMKDFQRGWYWHLLLLMTRSKPLGYLPLDGRLWALAGACSKQYWDNHAALVLSAFKVAEFDGQQWVYSDPLLKVLNDQTWKHDNSVKNGRLGGIKRKRSSASNKYSFEFEQLWETKTWKCVGKLKAFLAFEKALESIQQQHTSTRDDAITFLAEAMEEFKTSPAGRENGLFGGYTAPHPASWLNAQRYFDDRRTWRVGRTGTTNVAGAKGVRLGGTEPTKSLIDPSCPDCQGSGWVMANGAATRCECYKRNRAANAQSISAR